MNLRFCKQRLTVTEINTGDYDSTLHTREWFKAKHPEALGTSHAILAQNLAVNQMSIDRTEAKVDALLQFLVEYVITAPHTIGFFMLTMDIAHLSRITNPILRKRRPSATARTTKVVSRARRA